MGNKNNFQIKIKYLCISAFNGTIEDNFKFDIIFFYAVQFAMLYTPSYWINNKLCDLDGHFQPRLSSKCIEQILIELGIIWYFEPSCLLFLALFFLQYSTERTEMKCEMFWIILSILLNCFSGQNLFCQDEVRRHNRKNYQWNISTFNFLSGTNQW